MIEKFKKINEKSQSQFSMPLSLKIIKECSSVGIDWKYLHIIDLMSIFYSLRIESANKYLDYKQKKQMQERGIKETRQANESDFNSL